jgi:sulfite reductase (ferredoxin)
MGRKFKMSFSSSDKDTGLSYLHDLVLFKIVNGVKGFKVMLGGGLGSQPVMPIADRVYSGQSNHSNYRRDFKIFDRWRKSQTFESTFEILLKVGKRQFLRLVDEEKSVVTAYSRN